MRTSWAYLLLAVLMGCSEKKGESISINIETPEGIVTAHETTINEPVSQKVTAVAGDELQRLQSLPARGPQFVKAYFPEVTNPDLKDYDRAFRAWLASKPKHYTNEQIVETLGGVLGNKMIADFGMEWVTVTDEYGTDYAIRSKTVEVMAFPFSTVLKRIENEEYEFMNAVYYTMKTTLTSNDYKRRDAP